MSTETIIEPRDHEPTILITISFSRLTKREREVAVYLALGRTCAQIAKHFEISQKTVDTHRGSILRKLKVANAVELALVAVQTKVIVYINGGWECGPGWNRA